MEIIGVLTEILFYNEENGYTVAIFQTEEDELTVVGSLPFCDIGKSFLLKGKMVNHKTYGEQFAFDHYEEVLPNTEPGIRMFLASGMIKGIGPKMAEAIVTKFGVESLNIILKEPEKLMEVSGIGEKKAYQISASYGAQREFAEISMYFQKYQIPIEQVLKIYKVYESETIKKVEERPFDLVSDIFGIGFKTADQIAEKVGYAKDAEERVKSGIRYTLYYYGNEGHSFVPETEFCEECANLLQVPVDLVKDTLVAMAFDGTIHLDKIENRNVVYLPGAYYAEKNICAALNILKDAPLKPITFDVPQFITDVACHGGVCLSHQQQRAVYESLENGVSVITGGPGTGKTTIINTIIKVLDASNLTRAIGAPTGRAAKRITETSGFEASTIHRLLEYCYSEDESNMVFGKNQENPLDYDAIIIDEASMIDLFLMDGLLKAIKPGTRLIMVGDVDQLPPVGMGNVLKDVIDSEVFPAVVLKDIFRQAKESNIVVNAHRINQGEPPAINEYHSDFFLVRKKGQMETADEILNLVMNRLPNYKKELVPIKDIQVLTPVKKGLLGSRNLNVRLQELLNPPNPSKGELKFGDKIFRVGDKVMQTKNNYGLEWRRINGLEDGQGVFNGDMGFIEGIDKEKKQVLVLFDEEKFVRYEQDQLEELEHAYAITVHKSQGSEFPVIVMPVSWFPPILATRNLIYTGVTRGKELVVLVGSEQRMQDMIDNKRSLDRYSGLKNRLIEYNNLGWNL